MYFTLGPCISLLLLSMLLCYCRVLHVSPLDYASWTLRYIYLCYYCVCYCVILEFYIFHPWTMPPGSCQPLLHPSRYGFHHFPVERYWRPDRVPRLWETVRQAEGVCHLNSFFVCWSSSYCYHTMGFFIPSGFSFIWDSRIHHVFTFSL